MFAPFFRNAARVAIVSLAGFATVASAQAGMFSDGYNFLEAVRDRDGDAVTEAIEKPGSTLINTRDQVSGETALHIVAERSDNSWIRFLLGNGANPNVADRNGTTPLMIAANLGNVDGVRALLAGGARLDVTSATGETPLIRAVHAGRVELVKLLLEKGADPDRTDNSGRSAREYIGQMRDRRMAEVLAAHDARDEGEETVQYGPSF